jgi:hypothetical protein
LKQLSHSRTKVYHPTTGAGTSAAAAGSALGGGGGTAAEGNDKKTLSFNDRSDDQNKE